MEWHAFYLPANWLCNRDYNEKLRDIVNSLTDADLSEFQSDISKAQSEADAKREQDKARAEDPQTLEDFRLYAQAKMAGGAKTLREIRAGLTGEQRARWDALAAEKSRADRNYQKEQRATAVSVAGQKTDGRIIETKHTRDAMPLS